MIDLSALTASDLDVLDSEVRQARLTLMRYPTLYMANPAGAATLAMMDAGVIGYIDTPAQGNLRPGNVRWCADNGAFSDAFVETKWWRFLVANAHAAATCLFAVAPDVVGDAVATEARSTPWLPKIRALGYPVAYVAQDGLENLTVPWDDFDALFIGGSTDWKLGPAARDLVAQAKARGKWVHMGRVNSRKRYRYAQSIGCDSVDGTFLTFGANMNLPKLLTWVIDAPTADDLDLLDREAA